MIQSITVLNALSEALVIEMAYPEKSGYAIISAEGLGPTKADVSMVERVGFNGSFFKNSRTSNRNIVLTLRYMPSGFIPSIGFDDGYVSDVMFTDPGISLSSDSDSKVSIPIPPPQGYILNDVESLRQKLYGYFPLNEQVRIEITTSIRDTVYTVGYVESHEPVIFSGESSVTISLICPRAELYANSGFIAPFSAFTPTFEFPFSNEGTSPQLIMSTFTYATTKVILYPGDTKTGFLFKIHAYGGVTGVEISDSYSFIGISLNDSKIITITGGGIVNGDDIIISSVRGDKYARLIRNGITYNILSALGSNPHWFELKKGDNSFTYEAATGLINMAFQIESDVLYEGI